MQKWRKDSEMAIYRAKGGDKWHLIIREREAQRIPTYHHMLVALVRESSDNDDSWANSQMQHTFWGRINRYFNCLMPTHWASRIAFCPLDSLIRPRELNMNQRGGANVQSCDIQTLINVQSYDIQAHLGLRL